MDNNYFTLLERDNDTTPWAIAFGSFDRDEIDDEGQTLCDDGYTKSNLMIIKTNEAQADIDAKVSELNAPLVTAASKAVAQGESSDELFMRVEEKPEGWYCYIVTGTQDSDTIAALNGPFISEHLAENAGKNMLDETRPPFIHPADCADDE